MEMYVYIMYIIHLFKYIYKFNILLLYNFYYETKYINYCNFCERVLKNVVIFRISMHNNIVVTDRVN